MSYVKNWIHCVWGTKNRIPFLGREIRKTIHDHIKTNAKERGIFIDILDGYSNHIHCLILLSPDRSLSKVIQLIKGESSFWINKNKLTKLRFGWAVEYFAVSVSESDVPKVREYIRNQETHHKKKSWDEEYNELITIYGFDIIKG
jgi:putative transposase